MTTPICDFVEKYKKKEPQRFHMPGHKGKSYLGFEEYDITEISGADSLFSPSGIIRESEMNASSIFSAHTFYSCEGSSLSVKAMVFLQKMWAKENNRANKILAFRNAHKSFLYACALTDTDVFWLKGNDKTYLSCSISSEDIENDLKNMAELPSAIYVTSPDYLGNITDLCTLKHICIKYNILLLVDNAHGAYLNFIGKHPLNMGADMVCDSAHKTLSAITGAAYLHINKNAPEILKNNAKYAMEVFASTSPSYLILQSLDKFNSLAQSFASRLNYFLPFIGFIKEKLTDHGYTLYGNEPLKLTIETKPYGYKGHQLGRILEQKNVFPEFYDEDFLVFMLPVSKDALMNLAEVLFSIPKKESLKSDAPVFSMAEKVMTIKEALFSPFEEIEVTDALGKILSAPTASCPPAVPIVVSGEIIDEKAMEVFKYYGVNKVKVVKKS